MSPAFEPKPMRANAKTASRVPGGSVRAAARRAPKPPGPPDWRSRKEPRRQARPIWVMARYHWPALTTSGWSDSVITRK